MHAGVFHPRLRLGNPTGRPTLPLQLQAVGARIEWASIRIAINLFWLLYIFANILKNGETEQSKHSKSNRLVLERKSETRSRDFRNVKAIADFGIGSFEAPLEREINNLSDVRENSSGGTCAYVTKMATAKILSCHSSTELEDTAVPGHSLGCPWLSTMLGDWFGSRSQPVRSLRGVMG